MHLNLRPASGSRSFVPFISGMIFQFLHVYMKSSDPSLEREKKKNSIKTKLPINFLKTFVLGRK